ncbi:MAG TPA: hypothetical protein VJ461_02835 [Candidatus Nanoarchaeia archaeon]|nr:hypothetical protein [Candidatus Nanoarchaeia archaeon]
MKNTKSTLKYLFLSLLLIILTPNAFGYSVRTGISPLNSAIEMISNLFNIEVLRNNTTVQLGFLKFCIFIVLFAVSFFSLRKTKIFDDAQGKKTAGIVSLAFSLIGTFMMPQEWLLATGGLITVIMSSLIFLGFFWGLAIVAVFILRKKDENDRMGWIKNLMGLMLLLLLLFLLDEWAVVTGLPLIFAIKKETLRKLFKP